MKQNMKKRRDFYIDISITYIMRNNVIKNIDFIQTECNRTNLFRYYAIQNGIILIQKIYNKL